MTIIFILKETQEHKSLHIYVQMNVLQSDYVHIIYTLLSLLSLFYWSFIESVLSFCIVAWFGNMILKNKSLLGLLAKIASKISGDWQDRLLTFYNKHVLREVPSIIHCLNYPLHSEFDSLPSGCHFRVYQ